MLKRKVVEILVCHGAILLRSETSIGHRFVVADKVLSFLSAGNVTSAIVKAKVREKKKKKKFRKRGTERTSEANVRTALFHA
ncbi:hypothetical protein EH171_10200 [Enterovibrio baiacu]|nr:hypothetical protein [Enterovibrio baiacu]